MKIEEYLNFNLNLNLNLNLNHNKELINIIIIL
jgi:hypothetical protein